MTREEFVTWYIAQPDSCAYCGLTRDETKRLRLRVHGPRGGYQVAWDIDRLDPALDYEPGNIVLSCSACNSAKGAYFTPDETRVIGDATIPIRAA